MQIKRDVKIHRLHKTRSGIFVIKTHFEKSLRL